MAGKNSAVFGIYQTQPDVEYAVDALRAESFRNTDILFVHCDDSNWTTKAKHILERTGAQDVASAGEAAADWQKGDKPLPRAS